MRKGGRKESIKGLRKEGKKEERKELWNVHVPEIDLGSRINHMFRNTFPMREN